MAPYNIMNIYRYYMAPYNIMNIYRYNMAPYNIMNIYRYNMAPYNIMNIYRYNIITTLEKNNRHTHFICNFILQMQIKNIRTVTY